MRFRDLPVGPSRHLVRFVVSDRRTYALSLEPTASGNGAVRLRVVVANRRFHARELERQTGLAALEGQARLLLNDLREYRAWLEFYDGRPISEQEGAERWQDEVLDPSLTVLLPAIGPGRDPLQAYFDVLEQSGSCPSSWARMSACRRPSTRTFSSVPRRRRPVRTPTERPTSTSTGRLPWTNPGSTRTSDRGPCHHVGRDGRSGSRPRDSIPLITIARDARGRRWPCGRLTGAPG